MLVYGIKAPKSAERIWINPRDCKYLIKDIGRKGSGKVVKEWPPRGAHIVNVDEIEKIKYLKLHWEDGVPWSDCGIYEYNYRLIERGVFDDGCKNKEDVILKYKKLDNVFEKIKKENKLLTRAELDEKAFRENGGVYIHLGPNGEPYFGGAGYHRFAIALVLGIPLIPAQIGFVHISALGKLKDYRCNNSD
ncbi:hypothetical protein Amet_0213 [Alkaliphilus metalliredigens QYMF]|uniref:Uncharacterized protein n=1 Tax=Alkaliphilus metalliredigens (strain QYMF) TaxID=293826 RepID=A6TJT0_ALKMQ|nr:hypothetical protein [Alkaliphilus metalliredigens]ABR46448.1 hypothetical protein Amet_0213 [Alkaliphilus metalliredigens QYMF]